MDVKFYGVRGSLPSPGPKTVEYGGNTSCVTITSDKGELLVLDSGTGIVQLGDELLNSKQDIHILLTHNHWDHIQGFPFFKPIYQPRRKINIYPGQVDCIHKDAILQQMSGTTFPVKFEELPSKIELNSTATASETFQIGDFNIHTKALNHPGGGTAYLVSNDSLKVAYVTDNELEPPGEVKTTIAEWREFIFGADLLIHDAQFTDQDLPEKLGWGHSTFHQVAELAVSAKVKNVAFISHDPFRLDSELAQIEQEIKTQFQHTINIFCAKEGENINLKSDH